MIQFCEVSKQVGSFLMEQITFELPPGYICGLAGRNGAGKTTLLHLLLGLYKEDKGQIQIAGSSYAQNERMIHDKIGTVLVEELFEAHYSLKENADYYGRYYTAYQWKQMEGYLERFNLAPDTKFGKLSRGQKLKCQFAFALSCNPKLLVLDEPTGNFDPDFREQFFKLLQEFIADGTRSVVLATHLTEDLDRYADYLIYLEKGKQIFAGDIESFRNAYRMVSGERYKVNLLPEQRVIAVDEKKYGTKALVLHSRSNRYDESLQNTEPTIEEFMYFFDRRKEG